MNIDEALSRLREDGLFAQSVKGKDNEIIGGAKGAQRADGSLTLSDPFVIYFDKTWIVRISAAGQHTVPISASTLAELVEIVCQLHREGKLTPKRDAP